MSVKADLYGGLQSFGDNYDTIVWTFRFQDRVAGKTIDGTTYPLNYLRNGHIVIQKTADGTLYPMPIVEDGGIATVGALTAGTAYTNGTYTNVPLKGGAGEGALATVVVATNGVSTVTVTKAGKGYNVGDEVTFDNAYVGGAGSGFKTTIATVTEGGYDSLPAGHTYYGLTGNSAYKQGDGFGVSVYIRGNVNPKVKAPNVGVFGIAPAMVTALKTALPLMTFNSDLD